VTLYCVTLYCCSFVARLPALALPTRAALLGCILAVAHCPPACLPACPQPLPSLPPCSPPPCWPQEYDKAVETYQAGLARDPNNQELKDGLMRCVQAINKVGEGVGWAGT